MTDTPNLDELSSWADAQLSHELIQLAARGEQQDIELKREFPGQARDLAKEIAAFATSNTGTILIGIADDGEIVGLMDGKLRDYRSRIVERIEGLCSNSINPPVTPKFRFGISGDHVVLAVDVSKGNHPIYYVNGVPYVRRMTSACPAEPNEVIDLVLSWNALRQNQSDAPDAEYLTNVASLVVEAEIFASELEFRNSNSWLQQTRSVLGAVAEKARELAAAQPDSLTGIGVALEELADCLDSAANHHLELGSGWQEIRSAANAAVGCAREIKERWIDPNGFDEQSIAEMLGHVTRVNRQLEGLSRRMESMADNGRIAELQHELGRLGLTLLRIASFGVSLGNAESIAVLKEIGGNLRESETRTIYLDGGQSVRKLFDTVHSESARLSSWIARRESLSV